MLKYICLNLAILFIFIAGCEDEKYSIEMEPYEEGIERTFVFSGRLSDEEHERLSGLYEEQIDPNAFCGTFNEYLPNDVGGAGFYMTFASNMGRTFLYSERFRGNDDLNYTIEQMQLLGDRFTDFLIGWLEYELGDEANFVDLKEFCNHELRQDVKNMAIYFWLSNVLPEYESGAEEEMKMRMGHYLIERDYFSPKEIIQSFAQNSEDDQEQMLSVMRRIIAEEMDYSEPNMAAERLEFLSDSEHAGESARQYIRTTEFFQEAWQAKKDEENDPYVEPPDLGVMDFIMRDIDLPLFDPASGQIEVKLACDCEPFSTNGNWDDKSGHVVWSGSMAADNDLPTFFYASWSEPNQVFQEEHFGCVALRDELLSEYCIWRESLDDVEAEEWDSFISSLQPSEDLEEQVSCFHFWDYQPNAKEAAAQPIDTAEKGRDLILDGLKSDKE